MKIYAFAELSVERLYLWALWPTSKGGGGDTAQATVLPPATGVKVRSSGQGEILKLVKRSR